ncbi:MAG: hypothetical protein EZS28_032135 [Streblomastix strix]|uniref:Uncharacterized protein n=1 Tax=Streblomastix strix TaxID=222440 RepID=A0A5J4UPE6_9EUKA|nr:MAG: hypothetical protein EZS28_032135 [Streblomastix strix]
MLESMISKIPSQRPSVQSLLQSNIMQLVSVIEKSNEEKESQQSIEQLNKENNELKTKYQLLEVEKEQEKQRALSEIDKLKEEKIKALSENDKLKQEKIKALAEKDQEKIQALVEKDKTIAVKEQEKQKELQEKQNAQSERDLEKRRADTEHAEVIRLTAEITRQNQSLLSVPSSLNPNMLVGIIPGPDHVIQQDNKIIKTNKGRESTVAFNPVITSGIVRFGGFLEKHPNCYFSFGIADSSVVFGSNEWPYVGENKKKTVRYDKDGDLKHIGDQINGNSRIYENKSVAMEPVSVINIPSSIRFYIYLWDNNSQFTITQFENVQYSSAKGGIEGQKIVEWGKEWKK